MVCIESVKYLFFDLVESTGDLNFLLFYKVSQDRLELFFNAIRACGGWNNNPTVQQFIAAYKRLFLCSAIAGPSGNCSKRDSTYILSIENYGNEKELTDAALIRKYDLDTTDLVIQDEDLDGIPDFDALSEYKKAAVRKEEKSTL